MTVKLFVVPIITRTTMSTINIVIVIQIEKNPFITYLIIIDIKVIFTRQLCIL